MAPSIIPPYLTSGATSRAHHAFVVKLDQAASSQAVDAVVEDQVSVVRSELASPSISTAKISQILMILLHCSMIRQDTSTDLDFALVHALKLAEGGKTLRERRMGYLYLSKCMPAGHDLALLFVNTIRKDISSSTSAHILLAASAITSVPSPDLAPAVLPVLISQALLRHKLPAVRKATLHSLKALCIATHASTDIRASSSTSTLTAPHTFALPSDRLGRLLSSEREPDVLSAVLKCVNLALKRDSAYCNPRSLWITAVLQAAENVKGRAISQITLDIVALLERLLSDFPESEDTRASVDHLLELLKPIKTLRGWQGALVIRSCSFVTILPQLQQITLVDSILRIIRKSLRSSRDTFSANDHCVMLRCLLLLPRDVVETRLVEREMRVVMNGLEHHDSTIRRQTLRLLSSLDPSLSQLTIDMQLEQLRALPEPSDQIQRHLLAHRALEIATVDVEFHRAEEYAHRIYKICNAVEPLQRAGRSDLSMYRLWEDGVTSVLETVKRGREFGVAFTQCLVDDCISEENGFGQTVSVLLASVICEHEPATRAEDCIHLVLEQLRLTSGYVQEPLLIALVAVAARAGSVSEVLKAKCLECVKSLQYVSKQPLRSRCEQVVKVLEDDLLGNVKEAVKSDSLIDWLQAITEVLASRRKATRSLASPASSRSPNGHSPGPSLSASVLRYDAYDAPSPTTSSRLRTMYSPNDQYDDDGSSSTMWTAGDLALMSDQTREEGRSGRDNSTAMLEGKLGMLALQPTEFEGKAAEQRRRPQLPDPFGDSDPE